MLATCIVMPIALGQVSEVALKEDLIVRYSLLDPRPGREYLKREGLPMLKSTLCLCERYLTPSIWTAFQIGVAYIIYTDDRTHLFVDALIRDSFVAIFERIKLINLDESYRDNYRIPNSIHLALDPVNFASVRRTLADSVYLPPRNGRLLLGIDVSFLSPPYELILQMRSLKYRQALYMLDRFPDHDPLVPEEDREYLPYVVSDYGGPQCPGLLGDFIYLGPGLHISIENIQSKIAWYFERPTRPTRTFPQSLHLAGYHGIDQFALSLAVAETVIPEGSQGCFPLSVNQYVHRGGVGRPERWGIEVIHDKVISSCGAQQFDQCDLGRGRGANYCSGNEEIISMKPSHIFPFQRCASQAVNNQAYSLEAFLSIMISTLCILEHHVMNVFGESYFVAPSYQIFSNDRSCGPISLMLLQEFKSNSDRLKLINFETDRSPNQASYARLARCIDARQIGEPVVALEMSLTGRDGDIIDLVAAMHTNFNTSHVAGKTLRMMDQGHLHSSGELVNVVVSFCLCGPELGLFCPPEFGNEFTFAWGIG